MRGVVFDMDGVLFDSEALVMHCWEQVAETHGIVDIRSTCTQCLGNNAVLTRQIFLQVYGADFPYDAYKAEMAALYHGAVEQGKLAMKPYVRETLQTLHGQGIPVGLASSTRREVILHQLELFDLLPYFDVIVGGDQVQHSKPHPEIYLTACETLGVSPCDAFAIEDSYNGIRAAHAAGMRPVMIPDLLPPTEEMQQLAEQIVTDLHAFLQFLFA